MTGPAGERWEVYAVLADSDTFGASPQHTDPGAETEGGVCCGGSATPTESGRPVSTASCC